jgi:hypothetical protein
MSPCALVVLIPCADRRVFPVWRPWKIVRGLLTDHLVSASARCTDPNLVATGAVTTGPEQISLQTSLNHTVGDDLSS